MATQLKENLNLYKWIVQFVEMDLFVSGEIYDISPETAAVSWVYKFQLQITCATVQWYMQKKRAITV